MEFTYILFEQTASNQAEYDSLIATYDLDGNVAKEERDLAQYIKNGDAQEVDGEYIRNEQGQILVKAGSFYWCLSKLEKTSFEALEDSGVLLGWSYTKNDLQRMTTLLDSTFVNRYFFNPEL
jgi:hypothetical protein